MPCTPARPDVRFADSELAEEFDGGGIDDADEQVERL